MSYTSTTFNQIHNVTELKYNLYYMEYTGISHNCTYIKHNLMMNVEMLNDEKVQFMIFHIQWLQPSFRNLFAMISFYQAIWIDLVVKIFCCYDFKCKLIIFIEMQYQEHLPFCFFVSQHTVYVAITSCINTILIQSINIYG